MIFHNNFFGSRHLAAALCFGLCCLSLLVLVSGPAAAQSRKTLFLPLKINAPDARALTELADQSLARELSPDSFVTLSRTEAAQKINYRGAWPPALATLTELAQARDASNVAVGTVTKIGELLSIDVLVFELWSAKAAYSSYRDGIALDELDSVLKQIVHQVAGHTNRSDLIVSIAPAGNKRIESGAILRSIKSKVDDFVDARQLRDDIQAVFSMGYFEDVAVEATKTEKGQALVFRVKEKPLMAKVVFSGPDEIDEEDVREAANIIPNNIVSQVSLNEAVVRIKELYKNKGFYNTKVRYELDPIPEAQAAVEVRFVIEEGAKTYIRKITFAGNKTFSSDELEDAIETKTKGWLSWFDESGVLKTEQLKQDSSKLAVFYYNHGFIEAKVAEPVVTQSEEEIAISFAIVEGPRFRVGTVDISGELLESKDKLLEMLEIRKEEYMNRETLRNDTLKLTDLYADQGYAFAEAIPKLNKAAASKRVDILITLTKGPLVSFNRVEIIGNTRTRDNVIRRDLKIEEGATYSSKALRDSSQKLQKLGYFEEVNITPQPTMNEALMDVKVEVKERSTGQFSVGAGYSSSEYLMFMSEISENNFLGTGDRIALSASISGSSTKYNLSFTDPRILDTSLSGGFDLFDLEREYDDYTKDSTGGALRFGHPLAENWRLYYKYSYTDTVLSDVAEDASYYIKQSQNVRITSAIQPTVVRDTTDRYFSPTKGSRQTASVKYAGGPLGGEAAFTKLEAENSWYHPLFTEDLVFHFNISAGRAYENETDMLPVYENFYLGGLSSIRGFKSWHVSPKDPETGERIGGDKMWYTNFELIFPLVKDAGLQGVVFSDFGNVYATYEEWELSDYKKAVGLGCRWLSPLGPLRLEWGYNLEPEDDEDSSVWDFSIGSTF